MRPKLKLALTKGDMLVELFQKSPLIKAAWRYILGVLFPFLILSERYFEPGGLNSTIYKKVSNPSLEANLTSILDFAKKIHPCRQIWSNQVWNLLQWTQLMVSNTYLDVISSLDQIFDLTKKKVSFSIFYTIFLKEYFKALFKQLVFEKFQFFFDVWLRSVWRL